jgi:hypothetical protein
MFKSYCFGSQSSSLSSSAVQGRVTGGWSIDPRLPELGWRGVFTPEDAAVSGVSSSIPEGMVAYRRVRYLHGVAEGIQELASGTITAFKLFEPYDLTYCTSLSLLSSCASTVWMLRWHLDSFVLESRHHA